jgi:hypothetical protein
MNEHALREDVATHLARNAALVRNITSRGGDVQRERAIDCFFHTRTEDDAISLARLLQAQGFRELSITHIDNESEHPWTVQGGLMSSVSDLTAPDCVEHFVRLAAEHDALFDGWGTLLDELPPTI